MNKKNYNEKKLLKLSSKKNIIVNYTCFCKKYFFFKEKVVYLLPCCHMIHETCMNKYIIDNYYNCINNNINEDYKCPFCNNKFDKILSEKKIFAKDKYNLFKNDILSVKIDSSMPTNYFNLPNAILKLNIIINLMLTMNSFSDAKNIAKNIFNLLNYKINIIDNTNKNPIIYKNDSIFWKNKFDNERKIVIISNHSFYMDIVAIMYLFGCGFISNDFIKTIDFGKLICEKLNLLVFKRGVDTNMVEKIKEYLNTITNRIAIFPEGAFFNNQTLGRFRTGAFYVNEAICPIVIKYSKIPYSESFNDFLLKVCSTDNIKMDIYINDFIEPPFSEKKIENVRKYMAKIGNLKLSRVSNKSIKN